MAVAGAQNVDYGIVEFFFHNLGLITQLSVNSKY